MKTRQTKYRFEYYLSVPIINAPGQWISRKGHKTVMGDCALTAARNLYSAVSKKWLMAPKLEIDYGAKLKPEGWEGLNPDILPEINANLHLAFQVGLRDWEPA